MRAKKLSTLIILLFTAVFAHAATRLVPAQYPNIQAAIDDCNDGDTVIVAPGTYTGPGNHDIDFKGKAITVRSTDPNDPNVVAATIIDCNAVPPADYHRGFNFESGEDANSILAGLTIINGYANGAAIHIARSGGGSTGKPETDAVECRILNCVVANNTGGRIGGGLEIISGNPTISNCIFTGNSSWAGGAVDCHDSNPVITNCTITGNSAATRGGALNCYDSNALIANCIITGNSADYGGAVYCYDSNAVISNCTIAGNSANEGGAVYCHDSNALIANCIITGNSADYGGTVYSHDSNAVITNCTITGNSANEGGAVYCQDSNAVIANCTITGTTARGPGGAIYCHDSNAVIANCIMTGNSAYGGGGAVYCYDSAAVIANCTISANQCRRGRGSLGGAIYHSHGSLIITNCTISDNKAIDVGSGGGIYVQRNSPIIAACLFSANTADSGAGGGIYFERSSPIIAACLFSANSADSGGAIRCSHSDVHIANCTFAGNSADAGGAIAELGNGATVTNSIFWKNTPSAIYASDGTPVITYCNMPDAFGGPGNIDAEPYFADANNGDYHLKSRGWRWDAQRKAWTWDTVTSRCIDAGNPDAPLCDEPLFVPVDPTGYWGANLRIDMGAYGGTAEASIPPHGWAIRTDYSNDGIGNFTDFAYWTKSHPYTAGEPLGPLNPDPALDLIDLAVLAADWLDQTTWFGTVPPPTAAWNPNPPDGSVGIRLDPALGWEPGFGATSHDVYFGASDPPTFQASTTATTFAPGNLSTNTTYYWRIDEVNPFGKTAGPVWSFTTGTGGGH
jgi:predicted outer membrane repeat protein